MRQGGRSKLNMQIREEACEWFIESRAGDMDEAMRAEFDRWLRMSPEHMGAYLEIAAIWNEGAGLDAAARYDSSTLIAQAGEDRDNVVALPQQISGARLETVDDPLPRGVHKYRRWQAAAVAASVVALALGIGGYVWIGQLRAPYYSTSIGEQRSLELADGTTVALNSRSKIRVRLTAGERDVDLLQGQALFHVAKDSARPFIVSSGTTRVRAIGTEFDVYQKSGGTVVTVVEGRVAIAPDRAGSVFASAGEQFIVTQQRIQKDEHPSIAGATAWTQRQIIFESASLSAVAEEFNRYNKRQLVLQDPGIDTFHISGVFSSTDPASLIRFLRSRPGLTIVETPNEIVIQKNISPGR
ncbi:MAG TPA: FecR domain-containing protein [Steroidobacteraceae bacterium]|nr:FecR domain-containing protein [Steroidobacteraceae bacterium]